MSGFNAVLCSAPKGTKIDSKMERTITNRWPAVYFIVASLLGIAALLAPIPQNGALIVPLGIASQFIKELVGSYLPAFVVYLCIISCVGSLLYQMKGDHISGNDTFSRIFHTTPVWSVIRWAGTFAAIFVWLEMGPDWLWHADMGALVLNDLLVSVLVAIGLGCIILPFLTDFGLMEFMGAYAEKFFRRLFTVPGRSAVDALASWLGGSSVGLVVTANQMRKGFYTQREAAVIATNFSIVSITFAYVVVETLDLLGHFYLFYATLIVAGMACAIILPRIPPLSKKADTSLAKYTPPAETVSSSTHKRAWTAAIHRAENAPSIKKLIKGIGLNILEIWLGILPAAMFIATAGLLLAEYTPISQWLSMPIAWILDWFSVDDSTLAAQAMVIGFADMFLPALIGEDITSESTRFIIAILAVGQLIFMSETGVVILKLGFPIKVIDLVALFILRTLIILPVALASAALFM